MKTTQMRITPKQAQEWISKVPVEQRKLRTSVVQRYARDMKNGNWKQTHQGLAFNTRGELIDGQHRLNAIILADIDVVMLVTTDVPCAAFSHLDLGMGRTIADVLRGEGEDWITADHIAIARLIEANGNSRQTVAGRSAFEMKEIVYRHRNAISFVLSNLERRVKGVTIGPCLAAIASAYYGESDRVRLAEFCRVLVSGIVSDQLADSSAIVLRDYLKDSMGSLSAGSRVEIYLKSQRAIRSFLRRERLNKLYMPSSPIYTPPVGAPI